MTRSNSLERIARKLTEIDELHDKEIVRQEAAYKAETGKSISFGPHVDLLSSIHAISAVQQHLEERGVVSIALERLKLALNSTLRGVPPAMLIGPTLSHRAPSSPKVQEIKGMLAAAMQEYKRRNKLSRPDAARAVLKNISPALKLHLSKMQLSIRVILDWRDTFGSATATPSPGKDAYTKFKKAFSKNPDSHDEYIRLLTAQYARKLPSL